MEYSTLKLVHESAVAISITGFAARGIGMLAGATWVRTRGAQTLPHVVDTVLIVSAVGLAWTLGLSPAAAPWLAAKIAGLLAYIALGMIALRFGRTRGIRTAAFIAALVTFAWIVSVAITKDPRGFVVWIR